MTTTGQIDQQTGLPPDFDGLAVSGTPSFAWRARDSVIIWANAGGLALWGATNIEALARRPVDRSMPAAAQLRRLALVLAETAEDTQDFMFWLPPGSLLLKCRCRKLRAGGDDVLLLQIVPETTAVAARMNGHALAPAARAAPPLAARDAETLAEIARMIRRRTVMPLPRPPPDTEPLAPPPAPELAPGSPDVLARLSHELRTPLNAIIGYGELLQSEHHGPLGSPKYRAYSADMLAAARHCLSLVNDLFDMTKLAAGEHRPEFSEVNLDDAVRESLGIVMPIAGQAGVALVERLAPNLPLAILDRRGLRQILLNLLGNAIKFTPRGGSVTVTSLYIIDVGLEISVLDTGGGMTAGALDAARGQNVDGTGPIGGGLGLPISRAIAQANGGSLRVDSTPGQGTEAALVLPMTRLLLR